MSTARKPLAREGEVVIQHAVLAFGEGKSVRTPAAGRCSDLVHEQRVGVAFHVDIPGHRLSCPQSPPPADGWSGLRHRRWARESIPNPECARCLRHRRRPVPPARNRAAGRAPVPAGRPRSAIVAARHGLGVVGGVRVVIGNDAGIVMRAEQDGRASLFPPGADVANGLVAELRRQHLALPAARSSSARM